MEKEQIAFIIKAGKHERLLPWIEKAQLEFEVALFKTEYPGHALTLTVEAIVWGAKKIVAAGGDGTLNEVVNAIIASGKTGIPVLFLPAGTANDWGKTTAPPKGPEAFVSRLHGGGSTVDIGKINWGAHDAHYFINVADVGMGAQVVKEVATITWNLSANFKFLLAILKVFSRFRNEAIECWIDGQKVYSGQARTVVIANGKYFGSGLCIAPGAKPNDGEFEVVIIGNVSVFEYLKYIPSLRAGRYIKHPKVNYYSGKQIRIETEEFQTEADGEWIGTGTMEFTFAEQVMLML